MHQIDKYRYALLIAVLGGLACPAQEIVRDQTGAGIVDVGITVTDLQRPAVKQLAEQFLRGKAKGASIARLVVATSKDQLYENYRRVPHVSFESAAAQIRNTETIKGPLMRVFAINGNAKISHLEDGDLLLVI